MTRLLTAAALAAPLAIAGTFAHADGLAEPAVTQSVTPVASAPAPFRADRDWTGFYAGASLGYADVDFDDVGGEFDGVNIGGHIGYNQDYGTFVLGAELEIAGLGDVSAENGDQELDSLFRAKVRAGYDAGLYLPYVTAGYAQANFGGGVLGDVDDDGYFYGVGLDYAFSDTITIGGEYVRNEFDDFDGGGDLEIDTFSLRVSYNF